MEWLGVLRKLFYVFLIFYFGSFFGCGVFDLDSEITVYPILCDGYIKGEKCIGKPIPLNRVAYRVFVNRQEIIYWIPEISEEPQRLKNCIVRNKKNWVGEYQDGSAKLMMVNGKFKVIPKAKLLTTDFIYVGKWTYWYIQWTGKWPPKILSFLDEFI